MLVLHSPIPTNYCLPQFPFPNSCIPRYSIPPFPGPQVHQFPESLSQARAVMLFNTAAVFCITRDNDKARKALQEVSDPCPRLSN